MGNIIINKSKEVEEALQKRDIEQLGKDISGFKEQIIEVVESGFKGVHARQDKTNGNVVRNKGRLSSLEDANIVQGEQGKYQKILWYSLTTTISVIIALGSYILFNNI